MALTTESTAAPATAQANISRIVRMLLAAADIRHQKELAAPLHVGESGVSEKFTGKRFWTIEDVVALVDFFTPLIPDGVHPGIFFEDPSAVAARLAAIGYKLNLAGEPFDLLHGTTDAIQTTLNLYPAVRSVHSG